MLDQDGTVGHKEVRIAVRAMSFSYFLRLLALGVYYKIFLKLLCKSMREKRFIHWSFLFAQVLALQNSTKRCFLNIAKLEKRYRKK